MLAWNSLIQKTNESSACSLFVSHAALVVVFHSKKEMQLQRQCAECWQLYARIRHWYSRRACVGVATSSFASRVYIIALAANNIIRRLSFFTEVLIHKECDGGPHHIYNVLYLCRFLSVSALKFIQLVRYIPEAWVNFIVCPWLAFSEWRARMCLEIYSQL